MDRGERLTVVVVALYSIGLVFQVFDTLNYWFQARLQSKYSAIAELVSYAAMSVYKIILLALGKSVEWFAVASALDYIVLAVFLLIAYFKNGGTRFHYSLKKAKELLCNTNKSIKDISRMVGYTDSNYFARIFKRIVGEIPSKYREDL